MSKTVEWGLTLRQKKGMVKMVGLITNMIQDHDIQSDYIICEQKWSLINIHTEITQLVKRGTYDIKEQEFLNEVRNLVISYKEGRLDKQHWEL